MWLDNLKELKKAKGMTTKDLAEITKIPESTLKHIFAGETTDPYVSTLHGIVTALGGSLDTILANTNAVLTKEDAAGIRAENDTLRAKCTSLETEILLLKAQLQHKEELLAVHEYYKNRTAL